MFEKLEKGARKNVRKRKLEKEERCLREIEMKSEKKEEEKRGRGRTLKKLK